MTKPLSFEEEINNIKFTFSRICTTEEVCDQYSVMSEEYIFRMSKEDERFVISVYREKLPEEIIELEQYLSEAIVNYEALHDDK